MKQHHNSSIYHVLGIMSGTSLDGLDLAFVKLELTNGNWTFEICASKSIPYSNFWKSKLQNAFNLNDQQLQLLDIEYGELLGNEINALISEQNIKPDFIASHGHTVFHQPKKGITIQIGNAKSIHDLTKMPIINNFRALDVSLGGQGRSQ